MIVPTRENQCEVFGVNRYGADGQELEHTCPWQVVDSTNQVQVDSTD